MLEAIKVHLGIVVDDEDVNKNISLKIEVVKSYLKEAGAKIEEENNQLIGCVAIGVNDLLNNTYGKTEFSPAFFILARQLCRG